MVHNHPGSNQERVENYLDFSIWMGKLTRVQFETWAVFEEIPYVMYKLILPYLILFLGTAIFTTCVSPFWAYQLQAHWTTLARVFAGGGSWRKQQKYGIS